MIVPLPQSVRPYLKENTHLGLQLDKYVESWDDAGFDTSGNHAGEQDSGKLSEKVQKPTIDRIVRLSQNEPPGLDYGRLFERWQAVLAAKGAITTKAQTVGPLTLHLARASALENAGICLHPIYGFVYLPGTGLKGMARAYAETVWLPAQEKEKQEWAWQQIEEVFGWAANPDRQHQIKDPNHPAKPRCDLYNPKGEITASSGQIVFLDAWPEKWTPLVADILNNHHASYYQDQEPPGDWDSPIPVYFLAIPPGKTFCFALAKRRSDTPEELLNLAMEWLVGALEYEGAGAKTASGYGAFKVTEGTQHLDRQNVMKTWQGALAKAKRAEFSCTLELVTPAFLAGPDQQEHDCDLRPATLRGMLRWWWRTMHAGHVDAKTLARLEAAVWGDTNACGAVRVTVEPITGIRRLLYDKEQVKRENSLRNPSNDRTTPGLFYLTFGMDDRRRVGSQKIRYQRYYIAPGAQWRIRIVVRSGIYEEKDAKGNTVRSSTLRPADLMNEAQAALWLLCNFGGVGSKSRKGFGCFNIPPELLHWDVEQCKKVAARLRQVCQVQVNKTCHCPTLESMLTIEPIATKVMNVWWILDRIGFVTQAFGQKYARNAQKMALGLPRNVKGSFTLGPHVKKTGRHASPIIFHVSRQEGTGHLILCVAFPSPELPLDPKCEASKQFLKGVLDFVQDQLPTQLQHSASDPAAMKAGVFSAGQAARTSTAQASQVGIPLSSAAPQSSAIKSNDVVEVVIVEDPKGKGRFFARYEPLNLVGPILDQAGTIRDRTVGNKLQVRVHSVNLNQKQIQFKPIEEPKKK